MADTRKISVSGSAEVLVVPDEVTLTLGVETGDKQLAVARKANDDIVQRVFDLTKELGIPNACTRCHADQTVDWSLQAVEKWYGPRMERPTRARTRILARAKAGDEAVAGDLINLMGSETNAFWRAAAAGFMRRWPENGSVTAALLKGASDPDPLVRSMSLRSLAHPWMPP